MLAKQAKSDPGVFFQPLFLLIESHKPNMTKSHGEAQDTAVEHWLCKANKF